MKEATKTALKTAALAAAVLAVFAVIFFIQIVTHSGPAGALTRATVGSPEWRAAAGRSNMIESYLTWPLLVIAGAALQRLWCPRSALWTTAFVALPAAVARFTTQLPDVLLCFGYIALALLTGLAGSHARKRSGTTTTP